MHPELLGLLAVPKAGAASPAQPATGEGLWHSRGSKAPFFIVSHKTGKNLWEREFSVQTPQKMGSVFECLINTHPNVAQKLSAGIKICPAGRVPSPIHLQSDP